MPTIEEQDKAHAQRQEAKKKFIDENSEELTLKPVEEKGVAHQPVDADPGKSSKAVL